MSCPARSTPSKDSTDRRATCGAAPPPASGGGRPGGSTPSRPDRFKLVAAVALVLAAGFAMTARLLGMAAQETPEPESAIRGTVARARTDMRMLAVAMEAYFIDNDVYPTWGIANERPRGTMTYNFWATSQAPQALRQGLWHWEPRQAGTTVTLEKVVDSSADPTSLPCFALNGPDPGRRFFTLTTPISYLTQYPADPFSHFKSATFLSFSQFKGATFVYWSVRPGEPDPSGQLPPKDRPVGGVGWILISPGPDLKYDIPGDWDVYNPAVVQPSSRLLGGTNKRGFAYTYDPTNGLVSHGDIWRVKQ